MEKEQDTLAPQAVNLFFLFLLSSSPFSSFLSIRFFSCSRPTWLGMMRRSKLSALAWLHLHSLNLNHVGEPLPTFIVAMLINLNIPSISMSSIGHRCPSKSMQPTMPGSRGVHLRKSCCPSSSLSFLSSLLPFTHPPPTPHPPPPTPPSLFFFQKNRAVWICCLFFLAVWTEKHKKAKSEKERGKLLYPSYLSQR